MSAFHLETTTRYALDMAPRALDSEMDTLYQLPLDEFTSARNALAKTAGSDAGRVRALVKPPIAAWAVNQCIGKTARPGTH